MIIAKTKLKEIPIKCTKCKLSESRSVGFGNTTRICRVLNKEVPLVFDKAKNNWTYLRPKWCPLEIIE